MELPKTATDWRLYTDRPGSAAAARRLTKALRGAVKRLRSAKKDGLRVGYAVWAAWLTFNEARYANENAAFGSCDPEPGHVADDVIKAEVAYLWG